MWPSPALPPTTSADSAKLDSRPDDHQHPGRHVRRRRDRRGAADPAGEPPTIRLRRPGPGARPESAEAAGDAEGAGRADQSEHRLPRRRPRRPVGRGGGEPARFDRRGRPRDGAEHRIVLARKRQGRLRRRCQHFRPRPAAHRPRVQGERAPRRSLQERAQRSRRRERQRHVGGGDGNRGQRHARGLFDLVRPHRAPDVRHDVWRRRPARQSVGRVRRHRSRGAVRQAGSRRKSDRRPRRGHDAGRYLERGDGGQRGGAGPRRARPVDGRRPDDRTGGRRRHVSRRPGEIRQFELTGPDLNAQANGTIALNTSGQSNLAVRANTSSLEALTRLVNQKATGIATVEATITGNRSDLRAAGRLTGNDVEFGGQSALQLASDFTAHVPDLAFEHADVSATTNATFAIVGGQDINELTAKTDYDDQTSSSMSRRSSRQRSLSADGSLALQPGPEPGEPRPARRFRPRAWPGRPHPERRRKSGTAADRCR